MTKVLKLLWWKLAHLWHETSMSLWVFCEVSHVHYSQPRECTQSMIQNVSVSHLIAPQGVQCIYVYKCCWSTVNSVMFATYIRLSQHRYLVGPKAEHMPTWRLTHRLHVQHGRVYDSSLCIDKARLKQAKYATINGQMIKWSTQISAVLPHLHEAS